MQYWVIMPVMRNLILLGAKNDADIASICRAGNISPQDLDNHEMKVSLESNIAIMEALLHITGDKNMGLHLGEQATPPIIGPAGHLQYSASDVLSAFKKIIQLTRTFTALYDFSFEEDNHEIRLYFEPVQLWDDISPETARHGVDISFAAAVNFIKVLSGRSTYPLKVSYKYPAVSDVSEHERIFKCRPVFNRSRSCITFEKSGLQLLVLGHNPQLNSAMEMMLYEKIKESQEGTRFSVKVKEVMLNNYQSDFPQLESIALALNITTRTLQRKLQKEDTSYRELTDAVKFELASALLRRGELTVSEISYRLGYSDPATFGKAFKQWSGMSPLGFRKACE
jgi:AraC-like DNA-binding protein